MRRSSSFRATALAGAGLLVGEAAAGLSFTIDILTPDEFKATLSGEFDADVVGDQKNWLAFKNDWTNNFGVNTPWLDDSLGFGPIDEAPWTVVENSVLIDGQVPAHSIVAATPDLQWGDSVYWQHSGGDILAGMTVSGSIHVRATGLFDPSIRGLELLSGFDNDALDWARLEAVPTPGAFLLLGIAGLAVTRRARSSIQRRDPPARRGLRRRVHGPAGRAE